MAIDAGSQWAGRNTCGCAWALLGQGVVVLPCATHHTGVLDAMEIVDPERTVTFQKTPQAIPQEVIEKIVYEAGDRAFMDGGLDPEARRRVIGIFEAGWRKGWRAAIAHVEAAFKKGGTDGGRNDTD